LPVLQFTAFAGWEVYDDFNDKLIDASKWDTHASSGGSATESSGYLVLSAATLTEPGVGAGTSTLSAVNLTSRLEHEDIIKGLRMTYFISKYCDATNDAEYLRSTAFSPGRYFPIPAGYDVARLQMMSRSLTHDSIPSDEQLIVTTRITLANSEAYTNSPGIIETKNGIKTQVWSRFNDDDGYDGYNLTDHELEDISRSFNNRYTGKWSQMTSEFIASDKVTTSASWTDRRTHYEDPGMRLIDHNDPPGTPGFFGVASGQFSIWFHAAPKITGAMKHCRVWIDKVEVYR